MNTFRIESLRVTFKRKFVAGLFISIPIVITLFVVFTLFRFVDGILGPFFDMILGRHFAGLGFAAAIVVVFLLGVISTNVFGKKIMAYFEALFLHIPVFKGIYTGLKQLVDAFTPENRSAFKKFVIVEYPRPGVYSFGFLTRECTVRSDGRERKLKAIYIPTNNLYLGEVVLFEDQSIMYTAIPIEEGIRIILSGGIATPSTITESAKG